MKKCKRILKSFLKIFKIFCFYGKKKRKFEKKSERLAFLRGVVYNRKDEIILSKRTERMF